MSRAAVYLIEALDPARAFPDPADRDGTRTATRSRTMTTTLPTSYASATISTLTLARRDDGTWQLDAVGVPNLPPIALPRDMPAAEAYYFIANLLEAAHVPLPAEPLDWQIIGRTPAANFVHRTRWSTEVTAL